MTVIDGANVIDVPVTAIDVLGDSETDGEPAGSLPTLKLVH